MTLRKYYIRCVKKFTVLAANSDEAMQNAQQDEPNIDPETLEIYDDHEHSGEQD